jgi:hypothetical protein
VETLNHLERLTGYGVNYGSFAKQYLDSTGMFKEAVIGILAAVAKQERVRLSERTIAGLQRAKAQGRTGGPPQGRGCGAKTGGDDRAATFTGKEHTIYRNRGRQVSQHRSEASKCRCDCLALLRRVAYQSSSGTTETASIDFSNNKRSDNSSSSIVLIGEGSPHLAPLYLPAGVGSHCTVCTSQVKITPVAVGCT